MPTQFTTADLVSRVRRYLPNPQNTDFPSTTDVYAVMQEATQEFARDLLQPCPWLGMQAPALMTTSDGGLTWQYGTDADGNPISPLGATSIYRRREDVQDFPLACGTDYYDEGTQIRMPANRADPISYPDGAPYFYGNTPQVYVDGTHNPNVNPVDIRIAIVWKTTENLLIALGADETKAAGKYAQLLYKIVCSEQLAQQSRGDLLASRSTAPRRFQRMLSPYSWGGVAR
jgi:hypothetical protein